MAGLNLRTTVRKQTLVFVVAVLMIIFGFAEVVTGFAHDFVGLVTAADALTTVMGVGLGLCYVAGGTLLLWFTRGTVLAAVLLLLVDILGRIAMTLSGMYPVDTPKQVIGIVGGTFVAVIFAGIAFWKYRVLSRIRGSKDNLGANNPQP
ncbi:hypothetical protein ACX801_24245 [Arthrobacter bambusae]|uniref:hypothetical protein n=1 Tax=Arthrobacter sp. efr-133-R2A-120 TaxID=3040277 RepID=UPI0025511580|nr:hypothetical protein [Arthrobacter sp. efr-133-R2A-120]